MDALAVTRTVAEVIGGITLLFVLIKVNHVISLFKGQRSDQEVIIKNQITIMATLKDFQDQAARIDAATQNISAYVTGSGMSAADQDAALQAVTEAADKLTAAIPAAPAAPTDGQPA